MVQLKSVYALGVAAFAALGVAAPTGLEARAVSSEILQQLTVFAQWSAASYCTDNINSPGTKLTCSAGNCPLVEAANTESLSEFNESSSFGDVAGFLAVDTTNELLVVSFRGSRTLDTWIANLDFGLRSISDVCTGCAVHSGFWKSWEVVSDKLTAQILAAQQTYPGYTLVITGHSFGAALATISAAVLRKAGIAAIAYPFASPRVGNLALAEYITAQGSNYRVTHTNDLVPRLPPRIAGFSHISPEYWITSPNEATVTAADINLVEGINSKGGNTGEATTSTEAHNWYIVHIDACQ
ncbi:lipase family protein [Aspergillus clavatus NRRL 1]|uniref:feruloyl esterase n=1 Tax=Aspergillus clavatus (strain ATCC 1007 / CBS 513.65 / DSM 816 / NCTC 3887 / NRRL 1 / QM 1276 / 107) TaxID=344612 RepID=A1C5E3_ASPCL|nr:extracellular lipase, putative [Aspergillus clavatus NRRL 1]EAW14911.1 extracellular lipase, putative [Aspergillus clavatus NRRL 1]